MSSPFEEIRLEQGLDDFSGTAFEHCEPHQPVGPQGIRRAPDAIEGEIDPFGAPGSRDRLMGFLGAARAAKSHRKIKLARDAVGRHVRIELKSAPRQRRRQLGSKRQRALEPALPDEAPGTDHIRDDVDLHFPPALDLPAVSREDAGTRLG
jgi:hypothetical protein